MFRFISQVFSGMRSCLAWWSSVSEDRAKFLTQFLSHGIVFERAWALSLYRVGMALVALLAAVTGTVEAAMLQAFADGSDPVEAVDVLDIMTRKEAKYTVMNKLAAEATRLALAITYIITVVFLLRRKSHGRTKHALVYIDFAVLLLFFSEQLLQPLDFSLPPHVRLSVARTVSEVFILSLAWALMYATSTHPEAARVGATAAIVCSPILLVSKMATAATADRMDAGRVMHALFAPSWWIFLCWSWWFLFSPRPHSCLPCGCRKCSRALRPSLRACATNGRGTGDHVEHIAGPEDEKALEPAKMCWVGRLLRVQMDNVRNLRVLMVAFWYCLPLVTTFVGVITAMAVMVDEDKKEVTVIHPVLLALSVTSVLALFTVVSLTVHVARAAVAQRDELIHDLVPPKVADALIQQHGQRQEQRMMGRKSRITPEQGAASGKKDSRNTGQHTDGDPEGEGQARMALGEVLSMPDMGADEGSTRGGPRLGKRSKAQGASSGMRPRQERGKSGMSEVDVTSMAQATNHESLRVTSVRPRDDPVRMSGLSMASSKAPKHVSDGGRAPLQFDKAPESTGEPVYSILEGEGMGRGMAIRSIRDAGGRSVVPRPLTFFEEYSDVSIMFSDLVGFTAMSAEHRPQEVLIVLHSLFSCIDAVVEHLRIMKHETIGDAYITASNLQRRERNKGTVSALSTAVTLIQVVRDLEFLMEDGTTVTMEARVGLHTGDVAAGVVGQKRKLMSLVGDTMNTASRMESTSSPSHIQASDVFFSSLPDEMRILFTPRTVDVKGKGVMNTWILDVADKEEELARFRLDLTALPGWSKIVSGRGL